MMPVIWKVPGLGIEIPGYGLMLMIGFMASILWAARRAERSGANPDVVMNCGFLALLGGVVGSRAMYVWHYWEQFATRGSPGAVLWAILDVRKGGLEVYGGFIAVVLLVLVYLWRGKHSIRWYLDIMAPSAALGMAIGRIGCFLNGCCFGGVNAELPWAVRFPYGSNASYQQWTERQPGAGLPEELLFFAPQGVFLDGAAAQPIPRESLRASDAELAALQRRTDGARREAADLRQRAATTGDPQEKRRLLARAEALELGVAEHLALRVQMARYHCSADHLRDLARQHPSLPVHPTQLYSTTILGLLAVLLNALYWRRTRDGQVICTMLLIEPPTRWVLELLRADNPVDTAGLTISQFLAIVLSAAGLVGLLVLRRMAPRSPRAVLWVPPPAPTTNKE